MHRLAVALAAGWYLLFGLSPAVESPPQPSPGIERALATVQVLERQFKPSEGGVLRAENSGHRISTRVTPAGVALTRGRGTPAERQVELRLVAATRGEERREISAGATRLESSRAEIHRPGLPLVEWYVNDLRGVEQGLDVERDPLPGEGVLRFVFETRGTLSPTESTDGRSIELHAANGTLELELGALVATDASQRKLPARMRMSDGALVYEVDDRGASYPIVVDPLATAPNFSYTATLDVATRVSISTAGDVNGDGYSDLLIGAVSTYLFLGSASGLAATPAWQADLSQPFLLPQSVSTAGDVNGDGYDDMLLVTAVLVAPGVVGSAYLFLGSPSIASRADGTLLNADWVVRGSQAGDWTTGEYVYFISATLAGDLNGDGFSDVVVGFPGFDGASNAGREGVIGVWLGSADIATRPDGTLANCDWRADGAPGGNIPTVNSGTGFGSAVSTAGDVNGDGFDDLIAGSPASALGGGDWGGAFVWLGSSAFASRPDGTFANSDWAFAPVHGSGALSFSGATVAAAGDVDGDGLADVLVSRHYPPSVVGPTTDILLFRGDATLALQATPSFSTSGPTETVGTSYQVRAATAGDVNGDGLADIVVGFPAQTVDGYFNAGEVRVFLGRRGTVPSTTPAAVWDGAGTEERFGASVGTAGDVNGDGFSDVAAIGMTARVFHGGGNSVTLAADFPFTVSDRNAGGASPVVGLGLGFAGDINGDGYGDAVVGVPGADHLPLIDPGRFEVLYGAACGLGCAVFYVSGPGYFEGSQAGEFMGWSVTGAGDVNGDGYADVIAGAPNYDATVSATTRVDAGRARIYYGTSSGLAFSAFTALPGPETTSAHFGMAVAGAGDVNGDGLRDVIVGAPDADSGGLTDNGAVYVYLGNAGGVTAVPVWSKTGTRSGARLGASVASAGDTNSDGYSDVIIGADGDGTDHQGAAYVYLGGVAGLATTEVWTREGTWNGDAYGTSVASAGDTNGDGYSDIIVGQPVFKVGPEFASRASIYFGSALGPEPYTNTILFGQYGLPDRFGSGVASAGDVDGDGFSDVIIGAQWTNGAHGSYQGRAYVFHGCSDGICTLGQTLDDCPSAPCDFGRDVAGGGDVNGDGFADVMIGAFSLDTSVGPGQGTAFVHFGNGGTGAERTIQQLGYYGLPIDLLGSAGATGQVRPFMVLHSAAGRSRVQLETELRPLDTDFTGVGTAISPLLDTNLSGQPASNLMACGLNQVCHWRARVRSRNPYFPRSPWFSPPGNALTETDVRGPTAPDADGDGIADAVDNCRSVANFDQLDTDVGGGDGVGDACDNCALVSNARVPGGGPAYLVANPWATLTGEQRDDDHDGYGNTCDADFVGTTFFANNADTAQYKASIAGTHLKYKDNCGTSATMPCAIFDLNSGNSTEATTIGISNADTARFKALLAAPARPGPRCPTCPLACTAGTAGSC